MDGTTTISETQIGWADAGERPASASSAQGASPYDLQLARRIANGDMAAFEEYYQRYHRRVYSLCLRMTHNRTEAEDLTQDIFIHVFHKIGSFRGASSMMTWLHRVTVNLVLMHFRKSGARRERTTDDGEVPEPQTKAEETQGQSLLLDRLALDKAIAKLPPGYRAVLILHDIEGYEHSEIARIRGGCVGTSKSQLHKARKRLRELLRHESQEPATVEES
jgi:RNA polymerase sigma-70 factor (ECF subfamily)